MAHNSIPSWFPAFQFASRTGRGSPSQSPTFLLKQYKRILTVGAVCGPTLRLQQTPELGRYLANWGITCSANSRSELSVCSSDRVPKKKDPTK